MNEKLQLLQASVDLLKEKLKANDFSKSQLQNRVSSMQSRINVLMVGNYKVQKENSSNLDLQLSNSHLFANSLKKVDTNATNNLRKLEQHFGYLIKDSSIKFGQIQQKMLGMLTQKEKILRNLSFQIQNHGHSIAAIQEWIKSDHQQINSLHLVEQNLKQKIDLMQKNSHIKMQILEEKIKYLQYFKESTSTHLKNIASVNEEFEDKLKMLKKELKKQLGQVSQQLKDKLDEFEKLQSQTLQKIQKANLTTSARKQTKPNYEDDQLFADLQKKLNSHTFKLQNNDQKFLRINKKIVEIQQKIGDIERLQRNLNNNVVINSEKTERMKSSYQEKNNFQDMNYSSKKFQEVRQREKSSNKQLLPRKNLFQEHMASEANDQESLPEMRGGIRGLLQKSKEKDKEREGLLKTNDPFGRKQQTSSRKGLPPVKQDPSTKKKQDNKRGKKPSQSEEEAMVYQIDQEGYLMDQQGNYLLDETGAMIRLSPEEIQEYMMEQQN